MENDPSLWAHGVEGEAWLGQIYPSSTRTVDSMNNLDSHSAWMDTDKIACV